MSSIPEATCHPKVTESGVADLDALIDHLHAAGRVTGDDDQQVDISELAVSNRAGLVLEGAVQAVDARSGVEVGCASALSTLHICRALKSRGHLSSGALQVMDPKQTSHWKNIGRRALSAAGLLDRAVVLHEAPAHTVLPRLLKQGTQIQFAFIDGWHMLDYVMVEAFYCDLMLEVGGVIALHDLWMPGLQVFAAAWCANRRYEPVSLIQGGLSSQACPSDHPIVGDLAKACPGFVARIAPFVDQSVLLLRKTGHDHRPWDHYRDFWSA
ncbi:MAG: O-methyltransferase [Phycisphaerae bacterium]